jgi:hypothetical protein
MIGTITIQHLAATLPRDIDQRRALLQDAIALLPEETAQPLQELLVSLENHEAYQQRLALGENEGR